MNEIGSGGIATIPLLISFLLIGTTTSSVLFEGQDDMAIDAEQVLDNVLNELTTYLKIDDVMGKYYITNGTRGIEKIVILIKQFIPNAIDLSTLTIELVNNDDALLIGYSGYAAESNGQPIFEHEVWERTTTTFSLIAILDEDRSLVDHDIMNEDTAFIALQLPDQFVMTKGMTITLSLLPAQGIMRSIILEAPSFHSSDVISFGKA